MVHREEKRTYTSSGQCEAWRSPLEPHSTASQITMAIYHYSASIIGRSSGGKVTAAAAYRSGSKITDEQTGLTFDYRRKTGVDATEIIAPDSAPDWVNNRARLWNEVERIERRKDSQLAREINLALPVELTRPQKLDLVRNFVKEQFTSQGMVADVAFHHLDGHNPHAHILLTMRDISPSGFGNKNRSWNATSCLEAQRLAWQEHANLALAQAGRAEKIDHRSYAAQGINRIPQIHLGPQVAAMRKKGITTDKGEEYERIVAANRELEALEKSLKLTEELITAEQFRSQQQQRTAIVAPIIAAVLNRLEDHTIEGKIHTAHWQPEKNELSLRDNRTQKLKMLATFDYKQQTWCYKSLPGNSVGLSPEDVAHFQSLVATLTRALPDEKKQRKRSQSKGLEL